MAINYLRRVQSRYPYQGQSDVQRGIAAGEAAGKLLGGLSTALQGAQKDALANKLMNEQSIASQPGAGQTQDLGTLPSDSTSGDTGGSGSSSDDQLQQAMVASRLGSAGATQDLGQVPSDSPMTPDSTGAQIPTPGPQPSDQQLQQAMVASQLGGGPTVGSTVSPPGGPQPNAGIPAPATGNDFTLNPSDYSGGGKTVGGLIHTGGVQELELQKEMLAMQGTRQAQALAAQKGQMELANRPIDAAIKRAQLLAAQTKVLNPKTAVVKPEDIPITNLNEPVNNQGQLNKYVDTIYGKGTSTNLASTIMEPAMIDDPKNPGTQIPNPNAPQLSADGKTVTVGPKNKRITMPIGTAQTLIKQQNSLNYKQKQPLLRVPGEDQTQGSQENPYPVQSKLDMVSRASGTWVRLPSGQIAQVP